MSSRYRKKPLAQFEHGTRIYAPSGSDARFRVVATDPTSGRRIYAGVSTEEVARAKAREFEALIAQATPINQPRGDEPRTVRALAERHSCEHLAGLEVRYREKREYLARRWILPVIGDKLVTAWTPADSLAVLAEVRRHGTSDALVQDVGVAMRGLVTHARRRITAADAAGWTMTRPLQKSATKGGGWRLTGAALWTPHDLRHVAACWMLFDLGLDPAVVAAKLGHADPSFTVKRYVGVRGDPDSAAMSVTDSW